MRIVIGTSAFYPHTEIGGGIHTFNIARWLVKFGHEVTVLCAKTALYSNETDTSLPNYEEVEGIKIIRSKKSHKYGAVLASLPFIFEQYFQLRRMIKDHEVDIVNPVTYRSYLPFIAAAKDKVPCIATIHAIILNGGFFGFVGWRNFQSGKLSAITGCLAENMMLRLPYDGLMTASDWLAEELLKRYPQKPIRAIYGGVDLQEIDKVACNSKDPGQIVFLGSLIKHKNILDAIEATRLARKEIKDLKLVIISSGGEYEGLLKSICKEDSLFEYYKSPSRERIFKILKESSLLIHPSESETFGIAIAEALACGTPFIAYDVPSMREILQRMPGGVLVQHRDIKALSQKLCELLSDRAKREELSGKSRAQIKREFTWKKTARRVEKTFKELLTQSQ